MVISSFGYWRICCRFFSSGPLWPLHTGASAPHISRIGGRTPGKRVRRQPSRPDGICRSRSGRALSCNIHGLPSMPWLFRISLHPPIFPLTHHFGPLGRLGVPIVAHVAPHFLHLPASNLLGPHMFSSSSPDGAPQFPHIILPSIGVSLYWSMPVFSLVAKDILSTTHHFGLLPTNGNTSTPFLLISTA